MPDVYAFSDAGGHRLNEDAFRVQAHPGASDCWICFVADGQGGRAGGSRAAQLACQAALDIAVACRPAGLAEPAAWSRLLKRVDLVVGADSGAGFTTLVGLCVYDHRVVGASCGDSAALLVCDGRATELTAGQHKNPPIGCGAAAVVPFAARLTDPWRVLILSDGVWKYVGWESVVEIAVGGPAGRIVAELQKLARLTGDGGFQDDFTTVILDAPVRD